MKKILLIEDDELILKMLQFKLKKEGFQVFIAKDGDSGIKAVHEIKPDLVVTDIMVPFKSGLEITYLVKKSYPELPVIVLSALGEEENSVQQAFKLGASDFISKPFNPNELAFRVKRFI
ncbi:response regulator transcription factor [Cecembia calidifontis]|jgi:DNA-binding response OmpR family regulator|uniref:Response regulator receiver domain-containing protein n=1 Tax=Cecembia calidifontis TaxID=1187080 RepID=A0A4Q7PCL0_9BACT|nr:response regulator [Cecembia calidifontis]RZS98071.1 response regulator receiver domain-containing protein [Cecembia calidifontis]